MFKKKSWKRRKSFFVKIKLNLFSSGKHNSHLKQKPHEHYSKRKFCHDKQEQLSNDEHEFVKNMWIFFRQNHKTRFCDIITKPEIHKQILFKERRCFYLYEKRTLC